jgi:cAMP-dependent protein kinase regulator
MGNAASNGCCSGSAQGGASTIEGVSKGTAGDTLDSAGIQALFAKNALLKKLPASDYAALAKVSTQQNYGPGQTIIKQGDEGDSLYIISKGIVKVDVDGKQVGKMTVGECVGDRALLRDEPRAATITSETPLSVVVVKRSDFEGGGFKDKLRFEKRQAIGGGEEGGGGGGGGDKKPAEQRVIPPKTDADKKLITTAILANANLNGMVPMTKVQCDAIAECCWDLDVPPGNEIIKQGVEEDNPLFYIIRKGTLDVKVESKTGAIVFSGTVGVGQSFGELALIYSSPRAATITAAVDSNVWCIDRVRYQEVVADASAKEKLKTYMECLDRATFFDSLTKEEKEAVANSLTEMEFEQDETVFEQGEIGTAFYILTDGEVAVFKDDKQIAALTGNKEQATIFGEVALLTSEPRAATIKVVSDVAKVMTMEKDDFDILLKASGKDPDDSDESSDEDEEEEAQAKPSQAQD